ncbi:MAG: hypothetical protein HGA87_02925 [Desulfobulbaceae bacterium]|nr:hypothetical protein [Desulfobulbaceae bacterium]
MSVLGRAFLDKEIKAVLAELDAMSKVFDTNLSFEDVRKKTENEIIAKRVHIRTVLLSENIHPKRAAYSWVNNVSGDMLETGQYHVYRGALTHVGSELLIIFDRTTDELCKLGDCDQAFAANQKAMIRQSIASAG